MPSSSTTLLQKVLWAKLQSWLTYINGKGDERYRLAKRPGSILIQKQYSPSVSGAIWTESTSAVGVWLYTIVTLEFGAELKLMIKDKSIWGLPILANRSSHLNAEVVRIPYSDPELYKKIFVVVDRAKERATA